MRRSLLLGTLILAAIVLTAPETSSAATGRHCVLWISPVNALGHSSLSAMRCFGYFKNAQHYAHGPAPRRFALASGDVVATASTTISIDYDSSGFSGTSLTWTVSNTAGCNGFTYSAASMPTGWNDRVSSSHSYGGCADNKHFHDSNFGGSGIICTCSTMGTMNDQTSSERWAA
jgi:hypothetical protein